MASPLPTSARLRVDAAPPEGRLVAIQVRPRRLAPVVSLTEWDLSADAHLDHSSSQKRALTLMQTEHVDVVSALLGRPVTFAQTRRNLSIAGLNLEVARGRVLRIGGASVALSVRCHPCERMDENLGPGGFAAMFGHGGWCARVIEPGRMRVGDRVRLVG